MPRAAAVAARLAARVGDPKLGGRLLAQVVDAASGTVLLGRHATTPAPPASTGKLLTAAALLTVRPATYRITTTVVAGSAGTVVLVGGGDPTLTAAAAGQDGAYADAARLSDLAARLRKQHVAVNRIVVDDSVFTGPSVSPSWALEDVPSDYASAITGVMADGGRAEPNDGTRSATPDLAAGHRLAELLGVPSAPVTRGTANPGATTLARVQSAPIAELVDQMLQTSDNVIAECLARQVAIAEGQPASFLGGAAAIRAVLARVGIQVGAGMVDGSGLAARDRVAPAALAAVLRAIVDAPRLHGIVTGLPVAAWSGTLQDRYVGTASAGAGVVRAKTGTLTSVSALAGLVHDTSGRLLVFVLIADRVKPGESFTVSAEAALDRVAATLAGCGCR